MKPDELCRAFLNAETEEEVEKIIGGTPELTDSKNWHPLDGRETNFNVVTNQAMTGGKAATELMTNMVDSLLMKAAREKGIDPNGPEAPQSMYEAVKNLIPELQVHRLVDEDEKVLLEYARRNLVIGITGRQRGANPSYIFADNGEGQYPKDFEKTFLSLSAGTKKDIPFVQGKYNMGSSGVLSFCGDRWFKLIVSRKYDGKGGWGFTLVRKRPGGGIPIAEFFLVDGKIPTFETDMLYPFRTGDGKTYDGFALRTGTVIKLYDFQIGKQFRSFRGAREAFNENLIETLLPFRILDFRQKPDPKRGGDRALGIDPRSFYGMEYLLRRSHAEELGSDSADTDDEAAAEADGKYTVDIIDDPNLGHIEITAILLKRGKPKWLQVPASNHRVFHAVNGQVQFKQTRGFLTQCKLPALKDRVVVFVDASNLRFEAHNDIWKGDREHIRETRVGERYKLIVREAIEKAQILKDLQEKVAKEELTQAAKTQNNELFQQLVNKDPQIANLLRGNDPTIIFSGLAESNDDKESYDGKYSPTVFELETKVKNSGALVPINRTRPVIGFTDVENGYLHRADNKGMVVFSNENVHECFTIRKSLNNGRLVLFFSPVEGKAEPGMTFKTDVGLHDASMPKPIFDKLELRVGGPTTKPDPNPDCKKKKKKKAKKQNKPNLGLPPYVLLTKDGRAVGNHPVEPWTEEINDYDGALIHDLGGEGVLYKINYDNAYHLKYRFSARGDVAKDAITEKYIAGMRLMLLGLEHAFRDGADASPQNGNGSMDWLIENGEEIRRLAARGSASTVLALAEHLPKIAASPEDEPE